MALAATATSTVLAFTATILAHYGSVLFAGHPISMISACVAMLVGISTYHIGGAASPLATLRKRHASTMASGFVLAVVGFSIIVSNKMSHGKPLLPSTWHATLGIVGLCLMFGQLTVGVLKYLKAVNGISAYTWHGIIGPVIVLVFASAVFTGIMETDLHDMLKAALSVLTGLLLVTVFFIRFRFPFMKTQDYGELTSEERQFQRAYSGGGTVGSNAAEYGDDL